MFICTDQQRTPALMKKRVVGLLVAFLTAVWFTGCSSTDIPNSDCSCDTLPYKPIKGGQ